MTNIKPKLGKNIDQVGTSGPGGGITSVANGLTPNGTVGELGGALTKNTSIDGNFALLFGQTTKLTDFSIKVNNEIRLEYSVGLTNTLLVLDGTNCVLSYFIEANGSYNNFIGYDGVTSVSWTNSTTDRSEITASTLGIGINTQFLGNNYAYLKNTLLSTQRNFEFPNISGTLPVGTGTDTYITFWNSTNGITGDSSFKWDNTDKELLLGTATSLATSWSTYGISSNSFYQVNIQNTNAGASASSDFVATANNGNQTINYIDLGINSSGFSDAAFTLFAANSGYLYINGGALNLGTQTAHDINFHTGGTLLANNRGGISSTGVWTINTSVIGTASMDVFNTVSTTVNAFGAATTLNIGNTVTTTKTMTLFDGTTASGQTKTLNIGTGGVSGSIINVLIGSTTSGATGTLTIGSTIIVGGASNTTIAIFNTTATTINAFGAATTMTIGGTPTGAITHNYSTNATATATTKTINIGTSGASGSTTNINIGSAVAGSTTVATLQGRLLWATPVRTSTSARLLQVISPADTTLTASTESILSQFGGNVSQATVSRQFATGALTLQRENLFVSPTYAFVASSTITDVVNVEIEAPIQGTNAIVTRNWASRILGNVLITGNTYHGATGVAPTAVLHLKAGTATAGTAPFKYTAGTNVSVIAGNVNDGAKEFDGTNEFLTVSSVRYTMAKTLTASATLDFPSTAASSQSDLTITVTGASDGDAVTVGAPNVSYDTNIVYVAWVSATDTVTVRLLNNALTARDPASGTFKVVVIKF